jgi:hypothetical protein
MKAVTFVVLTLILVRGVSAQDCTAVFKYGIYDIHAASGSDDQASSFANWYCSHHGDSQVGPSFHIDAPELFGSASASGGSRAISDSLCKTEAGVETIKKDFTDYSATINAKIVEAYKACTTASGVNAYLSTTADPQVVKLDITYNPDKTGETTTVKKFQAVKGSGHCDLLTSKEKVFGVEGTHMFCHRQPPNSAVTVDLKLDRKIQNNGGSNNLSMPAIPPVVAATEASFNLRQYIQSGHWVYLLTNKLPEEANNCIGSISPETLYQIKFDSDTKGWIGIGSSGQDANCHTLSNAHRTETGYGCQNNKWMCADEMTPALGTVIVWGATFKFDDKGNVTHSGNNAGVLMVNPPGK